MPQYAVFVKGRKKPIQVTSNSNAGAIMAAQRAGFNPSSALQMMPLCEAKKHKKRKTKK